MVEVDLRGQPVAIDEVDRARLLDLAAESEIQERIATRRKLRIALQWCHLNPVTPGDDPTSAGEGLDARHGGECEDHIAGEGTPLVAAGSPAELGAALGITTQSAIGWMGDALELCYRLPRIWSRLQDLQIPAWKARQVAKWTKVLPEEGAAFVDTQLAPKLEKVGLPTIDNTVQAALATWRPDVVKDKEARGKDAWHVTLDATAGVTDTVWDGTSSLDALGDTVDFTAFADLVSQVAAALGKKGDTDTLDQRRAKALGVIGRGDHHALLAGASTPAPEAAKPAAPPEPERRLPVRRRGTQPTTLYIHTTTEAIRAHQLDQDIPLGRVERLGPATLDLIRDWVGRGKIRIQPVIDLNRPDTLDQHDPAPWMREAVILRDTHCVFPWCHTDARACDQDHIAPYLPHGPPGQTSITNLACLCRRHHNAKTHHGWRYHRLPDGAYHWTSPTGRRYLVNTSEGTINLR